ncbi:MAG: hypothetical protein FWD38_01455 [Oscillospiraceae bacterium]|nr:hypothetical protein [Oscillospiraceae bacterium]
MLQLKFLGALGLSLALSLLTSVTVLAVSSPAAVSAVIPETELMDIILCPCSLHSDGNDSIYGGGTGGGRSGGGRDSNRNSNDDENGSGESGGDSNSNETGCEHTNKCPICGDCLDCGNNPCPGCCSEDRPCNDCFDCIPREEYPWDITVVINDGPLCIGAELTFAASRDPSGYYVQWRVGGRNIPGANGTTYTVRPEDVDEQISVSLITSCKRYEGVSEPTGYVPYTINLLRNVNVTPMDNDYLYFGEAGVYTAYAASKDNGYVNIDYILHDSGYGADSIDFSVKTSFINPHDYSGNVTYIANPDDASNGVITIHATFFHYGIAVYPDIFEPFSELSCGYDTVNERDIIIEGLGNFTTEDIKITVTGENSDAFRVDTDFPGKISYGKNESVTVTLNTGLVPPMLEDEQFEAVINVAVNNKIVHSVPIGITVGHALSDWRNDEAKHSHFRTCSGCPIEQAHGATSNLSLWTDSDGSHVRFCIEEPCSVGAVLKHVYNTSLAGFSANGSNCHRVCQINHAEGNCRLTFGNHPTRWSQEWSNRGDGTCGLTCLDCSRQAPASPHDNAWTSNNNHTHDYKCKRCKLSTHSSYGCDTSDWAFARVGVVWGGYLTHSYDYRCSLCGFKTGELDFYNGTKRTTGGVARCVFRQDSVGWRCYGYYITNSITTNVLHSDPVNTEPFWGCRSTWYGGLYNQSMY